MSFRVTEVGNSLDEDLLSQFENYVETELPDDYRQFLLRFNGGHIEPSAFHYSKHPGCFKQESNTLTNIGMLSHLFGIQLNDVSRLPKVDELRSELIPDNLLPIGSTVIGDIVCMSIEGIDKSYIYVWHHDEGFDLQPNEPQNCDNTYFVAESFTGFIESLYKWMPPNE